MQKLNKDIKVSELKKDKYDRSFLPNEEYENSLPDLQNSNFTSNIPIEWVGMAGIRRPLQIICKPLFSSSSSIVSGGNILST